MSTCPEFDLFLPHKCPNPRSRRDAPLNFTVRHSRWQMMIIYWDYISSIYEIFFEIPYIFRIIIKKYICAGRACFPLSAVLTARS